MASARYNGFRLPVIPNEVANHPCMYIHIFSEDVDFGDFVVAAHAELHVWDSLPIEVKKNNNDTGDFSVHFSEGTVLKEYKVAYPYNDGAEWALEDVYSDNTIRSLFANTTVWSKNTMAASNGEVFIEGSDPIVNADESFQIGIAVGMGLKGW